jgi:hypothetical protein
VNVERVAPWLQPPKICDDANTALFERLEADGAFRIVAARGLDHGQRAAPGVRGREVAREDSAGGERGGDSVA